MAKNLLALAFLFAVAGTARADVAPGPYIVIGLGMIVAPIAFVVGLAFLGVWLARKWRRPNPYADETSESAEKTDLQQRDGDGGA